jgi:hypothetical protein
MFPRKDFFLSNARGTEFNHLSETTATSYFLGKLSGLLSRKEEARSSPLSL